LTLTADRCPARHQNKDYAMYLLTALYHRALAKEPWENKLTEDDRLQYRWRGTQSQKLVEQWFRLNQSATPTDEKLDEKKKRKKRNKEQDSSVEADSGKSADFNKVDEIKQFKMAVEKYRNEGESESVVKNYAESVRKMLGLPRPI